MDQQPSTTEQETFTDFDCATTSFFSSGNSQQANQEQLLPKSSLEFVSAYDLLHEEIAPLEWCVEGLLPAGLVVLGGPPKVGKSLFALDLALAIVSGNNFLGKYPVKQGNALYLSYEDTKRRLINRISAKIENLGKQCLERLSIRVSPPTMAQNVLKLLQASIEEAENIKIVVIDTYACFVGGVTTQSYFSEYQYMTELSQMANKYNISILVLHHAIKTKSKYWKQGLYGSNGMIGGVDGIFLLESAGQQSATLKVSGRDIEDQEISLKLDGVSWVVIDTKLNQKSDLDEKPGQQEVYQALVSADAPCTAKELSEKLAKTPSNISNLLKGLVQGGRVKKIPHCGGAQYSVANIQDVVESTL